MNVSAVTVPDAASSPSHPDHARWVKEQTIAMEIAHAQRMGGTLRDAESENNRLLARMEALARNEKPAPAPVRKPRQERIDERGVSVTAARPEIHISKMSPCGRCGVCRACMRERRVLLIMQKRNDDAEMLALANDMLVTAWRAGAGMGEFALMSKRDRDRAITSKADHVCERSIARLGPWLK